MRLAVLALALGLAAPASPAWAQGAQIGGGVSVPLDQDSRTWTSSYTPPFPFVTHSGTASQTLAIEPGTRPGIWGAWSWTARSKVGLEIAAAYHRGPISGENGPYQIALTYETRQPPDNQLREYHLVRSTPWPATEGHISEFTIAGSLVGDIGNPEGFGIRLSGGIAVVAVWGDLAPLGYTTFRLGGHAVVFSSEYTLQMAIERAWTTGVAGGVEVRQALGNRVVFAGGMRVLLAPAVEAPLVVDTVTGDTEIQPVDPAQVTTAISPEPLTWRPARLRLFAGLLVRL